MYLLYRVRHPESRVCGIEWAPAIIAILGMESFLLYPMFMPRKKNSRKKDKRFHLRRCLVPLVQIALVIVGIVLAFELQKMSQPVFGEAEYHFEGEDIQTGSHPIFVKTKNSKFYVQVPIELGFLHSNNFHVKPDDCIEDFFINDTRVSDEIAKYCDYTELGPKLDLSDYLKPGENIFKFTIRDDGGLAGIKITPAITNTPIIASYVLLILIIVWILYIAYKYVSIKVNSKLFAIFVVGSILRIVYVIATPYKMRGHDTGAHVDYIQYVAENFSIPPAAGGWEFHQAPLYYFITGLWMRFGELIGFSDSNIFQQIQLLSLIISIATLGVGIWVGSLLFPKKVQVVQRTLFAAVLATFPSLIFLSSRITNNALYHLFAFLLVAVLIKWWHSKDDQYWYRLCVTVGVTFLTKVGALVFLPIVGLCFIFKNIDDLKKIFVRGIMGLIILILIAGWLPVVRFGLEEDAKNSLSFGNRNMHSGLRLENSLTNFLTFNPIGVLQHPFNSPWKDELRRQYFWEYLFRSAFFGEFTFAEELKSVAVLLLLSAMMLIPIFILGLIRHTYKQVYDAIPMLFILFIQIGAHLFYRLYATYSSNQDFRFSILLLLPIAYFTIISMDYLSGKYSRIVQYAISTLCVLNAAFIVLLFVLY